MKDFLKAIFIKNWQYKLAAILTAIAMWFYVIREQNLSVVVNMPVELSNLPADMKIANKVKTSVDLFLEGRRDIVTKMNKKNIKLQLNLKEAKTGRNVYTVTASRIKYLPRGIRIKDVSPARIVIYFNKTGGGAEKDDEAKPKKEDNEKQKK